MYAVNDFGQQYHVELSKGDVGRYVILPGDPGRVEKIAAFLDNPKKVAHHREYVTYTGSLNGVPVSVTSTGIGGPSAAIALEELIAVGADTFIRIGTAGMLQDYFDLNDCIIATASVRDEGTSRGYMPVEYPAVANVDVVCALRKAAKKCGKTAHVGIIQSKDAFYGEAEPESMPTYPVLDYQYKAWTKGNVLASEMEAAALFVVGSVRKVRVGCILNNRGDINETIRVAVEGMRELILQDQADSQ